MGSTKKEKLEQLDYLGTRQQLGLYILMLMLKVVGPSEWSHEISDLIDLVTETIKTFNIKPKK